MRSPSGQWGGYVWTFPKGGADVDDKTPEETAIREVFEETGYECSIIAPVPGVYESDTCMTKYYLMQPIGIKAAFDSETQEVKWVDVAEAFELIQQTASEKGRRRDTGVLEIAMKTREILYSPEIEYRILNLTQDAVPYGLLLLADPSKELIDDYLDRGICYLAFIGEELVGEFVLIHTHPRTLEIVNIAVKEDYQGRGIGKRLLQHAIDAAEKKKAHAIEIGTGNSSMQQLRLYQKTGFRIVGIDHDFFIRNYEEEIFEDGIPCRDMIRLRKDLR